MTIDLNSIKSPESIKQYDNEQLKLLSEEIRAALTKKLGAHGGHVGPNLGVVEATVALHYVFDAPNDKLVFDVSHQTYIHKMLTGRMEAFTDPAHYNDVTGYTCPRESAYDLFEIGHTSTSISLAIGLAKARDIEGGDYNVVAFIGDASLGGGMALEGLEYAPKLKSNLIIVLNDNQRSIAENHGALFDHLKELRDTNGESSQNIFKALGYGYIYVKDGNSISALLEAFRSVKGAKRPVVVHINTMKGMGLPVAEANKEAFHWHVPFNLQSGAPLTADDSEDYADIFANHMVKRMGADPKIVILNAGTPAAVGFTKPRREAAGEQWMDVGICEQNAVTIMAGLARGGIKPVLGVMATFLQRAYDQISHDLAINSLPGVIVDFGGGVWGIPDMTHLGFFDIAMISNIPNVVMLAPTNAEEYLAMIDWSLTQNADPIVIRTPGGAVKHSDGPVTGDLTRNVVTRRGKADSPAIIGVGAFFDIAEKAADLLSEQGIDSTLINPRNISQLDRATLDGLMDSRVIVTLEDGIINGGYGEKVARYMARYSRHVEVLGLKKEFLDGYSATDVLEENSLTPDKIAEIIISASAQ